MLTQYNLKMPHAVYGGENAMDNITAIIDLQIDALNRRHHQGARRKKGSHVHR